VNTWVVFLGLGFEDKGLRFTVQESLGCRVEDNRLYVVLGIPLCQSLAVATVAAVGKSQPLVTPALRILRLAGSISGHTLTKILVLILASCPLGAARLPGVLRASALVPSGVVARLNR
jgi:hypothetical protein